MTVATRDILVRLTEAQYKALAGAVATQAMELDAEEKRRPLAILNRAWDSVRTAWYRAGDGF